MLQGGNEMEDRTFELLERMYSEFTEFRRETTDRLDGLRNDVLGIENNHGKKLEALFDGYRQHERKLDSIEQKVDSISEKVDRHDIKIQVIEGGRK
jgi:predicted RNase H-like nuclease (RuvC/YqgF family)